MFWPCRAVSVINVFKVRIQLSSNQIEINQIGSKSGKQIFGLQPTSGFVGEFLTLDVYATHTHSAIYGIIC